MCKALVSVKSNKLKNLLMLIGIFAYKQVFINFIS